MPPDRAGARSSCTQNSQQAAGSFPTNRPYQRSSSGVESSWPVFSISNMRPGLAMGASIKNCPGSFKLLTAHPGWSSLSISIYRVLLYIVVHYSFIFAIIIVTIVFIRIVVFVYTHHVVHIFPLQPVQTCCVLMATLRPALSRAAAALFHDSLVS